MSVVGGGCQLCLINFVLHASFYWLDRWDSTRSCVAHINKTLQQLWQHLMAFNDYTVVGWDLLSVFLSSYGKAEHRLYAFHPFLCSTCLVPRHSHEPKHTNCKPNIRQFSVNVYFITSLAFIMGKVIASLRKKSYIIGDVRGSFFHQKYWQCRRMYVGWFPHPSNCHAQALVNKRNDLQNIISTVPIDTLSEWLMLVLCPPPDPKNNWLASWTNRENENRKQFGFARIWLGTFFFAVFFIGIIICCDRHVGLLTHIK